MNRKDMLLIAILILVVIYLYQSRENATDVSGFKSESEIINVPQINFCDINKPKECPAGNRCYYKDCPNLCVSGEAIQSTASEFDTCK